MTDDRDDRSLVTLAAAGDGAAFGRLVERWQDRVFRLARRFVRRDEDAEEVAQEVFLKLYAALPRYRGDAPFEHYLLRIATNACRDRLRRRRRRPETQAATTDAESAAWLERALRGGALQAAQAEAARLVAADLLDRLAPKDRIVLVLVDLEGRSSAEVAAITGSTRAAVRIRASRARRALRRLASGPARLEMRPVRYTRTDSEVLPEDES